MAKNLDIRTMRFQLEASKHAEARRLIDGNIHSIDEFITKLQDLGAVFDGLPKDHNMQVNFTTSGDFVKVGEAKSIFRDITAERNRQSAIAKKQAEIDSRSALHSRQQLSEAKQKLSTISAQNPKYQEQLNLISQIEDNLRRASNISVGSVRDLELIGKRLKEQAAKSTAAENAISGLNNQIEENALALRRAKGVQDGSKSSLEAYVAKQRELANTLPVGSKQQQIAAKAVERYSKKLQAASGKTTSFVGVLGKLSTIQSGLLAITNAFGQINGAINRVVNRTKAVESFELALQNVGLSAVDTARTFNTAANSAQALGAPVEQVEKAYKRIVPALRAIGTTSQDTDRFIEALAARTQVLGLSTEQSGRLQEAFAQVLAKGKLQAEELTQQISEADGAFRSQFASALGVSIEALTELVKTGQITGSVFVETFLKMENGVEALKSRIENGTATIQQLQNSIETISVKTLESIGKSAEPGIRALLELSNTFVTFVQEAVDSSWGQALINVFNSVVITIEKVSKIIVGAAKAFGVLLAPIGQIIEALSIFSGPVIVAIGALVTLRVAGGLAAKAVDRLVEAKDRGSKSARLYLKGINRLKNGFLNIIRLKFGDAIKDITTAFNSFTGGLGQNLFGPLINGFKSFNKQQKELGKSGGLKDFLKIDTRTGVKSIDAAKAGLAKFAGAGVKAKLATVALGAASLAVGALVVGAFAAAAVVFNSYNKSIQRAQGPLKELDSQLEGIGIKSKGASIGIKGFGDRILESLGPIGGFIKGVLGIGDALATVGSEIAFAEAQKAFQERTESISNFLQSKGVKSFKDYATAAKLPQEELNKSVAAYRAAGEAQNQFAANLEAEIQKLKKAGKEGGNLYKSLERQRDILLENAARLEVTARALGTVTGRSKAATRSFKDSKEAIEDQNKQLNAKSELLDKVAAKLGSDAQTKYNQGLITEGQLNLKNAAIAKQVSDSRLQQIDDAIKANRARVAQSNQDVIAQQDQENRLKDQRIAAAEAVASAETELRKVQLDRLKEVKEENDNLVQSYGQLRNLQSTGFGELASGVGKAFDALKKDINRVATIKFLITGDKRFLTNAIAQEKEMIIINQTINDVKRQMQQDEARHKNEMLKLELQTKKIMLQADPRTAGNREILGLLDQQIAAVDSLGAMQEINFKAANAAAVLDKKNIQEAFNVRAKAADIKPLRLVERADVSGARQDLSEIRGEAIDAANAAKSAHQQTIAAAEQAGKNGLIQISNVARQSESEAKRAIGAVSGEVSRIETESNQTNRNFFGFNSAGVTNQLEQVDQGMSKTFSNAQTKVHNLNTTLGNTSTALQNIGKDASNSMSSLTTAINATERLKGTMDGLPNINRAMGGPVAGGSTYKVNDGGGRESFVDNTGKLTMLPAARNIKWTAPKSGYVLNAEDTKAIINNNKINASINSATRSSRPAKAAQSVSGIVASGTLIKQMGSMMKGGDTQRITNNVTIQSQSPVMDASKLLTDINIMRARRRGRL